MACRPKIRIDDPNFVPLTNPNSLSAGQPASRPQTKIDPVANRLSSAPPEPYPPKFFAGRNRILGGNAPAKKPKIAQRVRPAKPNRTAEAVRLESAGLNRVALGQPVETELTAGSLDPNFSRQAGPCSATAQLVRRCSRPGSPWRSGVGCSPLQRYCRKSKNFRFFFRCH